MSACDIADVKQKTRRSNGLNYYTIPKTAVIMAGADGNYITWNN